MVRIDNRGSTVISNTSICMLSAVKCMGVIHSRTQTRVAGCGGYVYLQNLVNFPAGVVPFGRISAEDEVNDLKSYPETYKSHRRLKMVSYYCMIEMQSHFCHLCSRLLESRVICMTYLLVD